MVPPLLPKSLHGFTPAIKRLCTQDNDFSAAEELFKILLFKRLQLALPTNVDDQSAAKYTRDDPPLTEEEIKAFQKSVTTLIRYAPNTEDALRYVCFMLARFDAPLRTRHLEQSALINIIYVLKTHRAYNQALDFINIGLERGILHNTPTGEHRAFDGPADVFRSVCRSVLLYHKLQFSEDGLSLERNRRT